MINTKWKHLIEDLSTISTDILEVKLKVLDEQEAKPVQNLLAGAFAEDTFFEGMEGIYFSREIEWLELTIENGMDQLSKSLDF
jgi:hypothetical protein